MKFVVILMPLLLALSGCYGREDAQEHQYIAQSKMVLQERLAPLGKVEFGQIEFYARQNDHYMAICGEYQFIEDAAHQKEDMKHFILTHTGAGESNNIPISQWKSLIGQINGVTEVDVDTAYRQYCTN